MSESDFSLLMAVYHGDTPSQVRRAIRSNTSEQTLPPTQVVIVRDGPVPDGMQRLLDSLPAKLAAISGIMDVDVVELERNRGLAHALNVGLSRCTHELVARADSDDISRPDRFATMIPLLASHPELGIVGSAIQEFEGDESRTGQIRTLPAGGEELARYARMQSPLHHPSVVFRRTAVLDAGGYPEHAGRFEDYLLWERLLMRGVGMRNLPEPLVLYRVDSGAYRRRGGCEMFREELRLQRRFLRDGFTTRTQFARNVAVRAGYRLVPTGLRRAAYHVLTAVRNRASDGR